LLAVALAAAALGVQAERVAVSISRDEARPAAGRLEHRAHGRLRRRFERAGLQVRVQRFATPRGRSRNVIGVRPAGRTQPTSSAGTGCLRVVMAHADTVPPSPGAEDNASGLGALAELAARLDAIDPPCTVWLVATGAEERIYTGSPDHLGSLALTRIVPRARLRYALSIDEVGVGGRLRLRSPAVRPRARVEREMLGPRVDWQRDSDTGNSDHREFELAGMRGVKLGTLDNPCRHTACDTPSRLERRAFALALRTVERALRRP
jgi:peptidase M28-like protein